MKVSKKCSGCGIVKLFKHFTKDVSTKDKLCLLCKKCKKSRGLASRINNGLNPYNDLRGTKNHVFSKEEREKNARASLKELTE